MSGFGHLLKALSLLLSDERNPATQVRKNLFRKKVHQKEEGSENPGRATNIYRLVGQGKNLI